MSQPETAIKSDDPFEILGVGIFSTEAEIRHRYLELIKLNPPEQNAARFREIHQAYEQAKDPLRLAEKLLEFSDEYPDWQAVIETQKKRPQSLSTPVLLALGNQDPKLSSTPKPTGKADSTATASPESVSESQSGA